MGGSSEFKVENCLNPEKVSNLSVILDIGMFARLKVEKSPIRIGFFLMDDS